MCSRFVATNGSLFSAIHTMNSTEEIVRFLVQAVTSSGPISGAQLGARIKAQFPGFDWKKDFINLHGFIQQNCRDKVVLINTTPDHMWAIADATGVRADVTLAGAPTSAWQALVNERTTEKIFVSPETGEIAVVRAGVPPAAGLLEVPKITYGDHLEIAKEFLGQVEAGDQGQFQAVLGKPDYWQAWNNALKFVRGGRSLRWVARIQGSEDLRPLCWKVAHGRSSVRGGHFAKR